MKNHSCFIETIVIILIVLPIISFADGNLTGEQGFFGGTSARYCSANADCGFDYICFQEHDGISNGTNTGSCYPKWETFCVNNGTFTVNSGTVCRNSTYVLTCSSGTWSASQCPSQYTCKAATNSCTSDATGGGTGTSGSGTGSGDNNTLASSLNIETYPSDFELVQNTSITKIIIVENDGDTNLSSLTLSITGLDAVSITITPSSYNTIQAGESKTFSVEFRAPENAAIGSYLVTATASAGSTNDVVTFTLRLLPSSDTVENVIIPQYDNLTSFIPELENQINSLKSQGFNTSEIESLFNDFKEKLNSTNSSIQQGNYLAANQFLTEATDLLQNIRAKMSELETQSTGDYTYYTWALAAIVIVAVIAVVVYKFMPRKPKDSSGSDESEAKKSEQTE